MANPDPTLPGALQRPDHVSEELPRRAHASLDRLEATRDLPITAVTDIKTALAYDVAQLLQVSSRLTPDEVAALDRLPRMDAQWWPLTRARWLRPARPKSPPHADGARLLGVAPMRKVTSDDGMAMLTVLTPNGEIWSSTAFGRYVKADGGIRLWDEVDSEHWREFEPLQVLRHQWPGPFATTPASVDHIVEGPRRWLERLQEGIQHLVDEREAVAHTARAAMRERRLV